MQAMSIVLDTWLHNAGKFFESIEEMDLAVSEMILVVIVSSSSLLE
jgi:hypothetical protein